ncbi:hypothetical protein ACGFNV_24070 [Streptomyces sp. NPDC048751]|uniref:hypothetical protein n=1 Tax=Streptomyces sp. NPDC048751 TaxID=3365591 RepID=UPI003714E641
MSSRQPLVLGTRSPHPEADGPVRASHASPPVFTSVPEKSSVPQKTAEAQKHEPPLLAGEEDRDEAESHIVRGID